MGETAKCTSWRGHKFEARYSKTAADVEGVHVRGVENYPVFLDAFRRVTYERDVCVRCGATVEKPYPEQPTKSS